MTTKYNPPISFRADSIDKVHLEGIQEYLQEQRKGTKVTQTDVVRFALYEAFMKVTREKMDKIREAQNERND